MRRAPLLALPFLVALVVSIAAAAPPQPEALATATVSRITQPGLPAQVALSLTAPPPGTQVLPGYAYPEDGSIVRIASADAKVAAQPSVSSTAQASVGALAVTLFDGEITIDSIDLHASVAAGSASASGTVTPTALKGLTVLGQLINATQNVIEEVLDVPLRDTVHKPLGVTFPDPSRPVPVTVDVKHNMQRWTLQQEMWAKAVARFTTLGFSALAKQHENFHGVNLVVWEKNAGDKPATPADLAAALAFAYDRDNLYVLVDVTDDLPRQPYSGSAAWMGDSVQLAFATESNPLGTELLFYRTDDGRKGLYAFDLNLNVDHVQFAPARDHARTTYTIALPLSLLQMRPQPGQSVRFSLIVNENDTGAREGYLRWADGIGRTKDPAQYGILILSD